jgi:hypothetical protein
LRGEKIYAEASASTGPHCPPRSDDLLRRQVSRADETQGARVTDSGHQLGRVPAACQWGLDDRTSEFEMLQKISLRSN